MKNFLIFIAGIITGVFTIFLIGVLGNKSNSTIPGLTVFDAPGEVMDAQSYKVFQVIDGGYALANASTFEELGLYMGIVVLIYADENSHYYDGQIITATNGRKFRQIGTYRYSTKDNNVKTVPAVAIFGKE